MTAFEMVVTIVGLGMVSLLTRGFFLLFDRALPTPAWLTQGLRYAPLGALVAIVLPAIVMTQGALVGTWRDPRISLGWGGCEFAPRSGVAAPVVPSHAVV